MNNMTKTEQFHNPYTQDTVPNFVSEYLELRSTKEIIEAKIEELSALIIEWGEQKIREQNLTSKRLPIPELKKQFMELLIVERKTVPKDDIEVLELEEQIKKEQEIAAIVNRVDIGFVSQKIKDLEKKLDNLSNTEIGRELVKEKENRIKTITYLKKTLMLRQVK